MFLIQLTSIQSINSQLLSLFFLMMSVDEERPAICILRRLPYAEKFVCNECLRQRYTRYPQLQLRIATIQHQTYRKSVTITSIHLQLTA